METERTEHIEQKQKKDSTQFYFSLLYAVIWPFFNLFHPVRAIGRENIPEGAAVICPNHTAASDPFYVVFAFGRKYPMWAMAKQQILNWPFVGWILGKAGVFGVDRGGSDMKAAKTALRCLKEKRKLLIFPEGTRVSEGETVEAKAGAALFATRTGSPILPVYVPAKKRMFRSNTVVIGKPYYPEFEGRRPTAEELQVIADDIMVRVHALEKEIS